MGMAFILLISGGFIGSRLFDVQIRFRRVVYLWWLAGCNFTIVLSQLLWMLLPEAATFGMVSPLSIFALGSYVAFGAAIYYGSAARSNDISNRTSSAWLGFVPFANLWLVFRARDKELRDISMSRSTVSAYVLDPILVMGAVIVLASANLIEKSIEEMPARISARSEDLAELISNSQTLEQSFATEARLSKQSLPMRVDEITVFRDIKANGTTLTLIYDVESSISGFRSGFGDDLAREFCSVQIFGKGIQRGGTIIIEYYGPDKKLIDDFRINASTCP